MFSGLTFNQKIHQWIDTLKESEIDGCITGSCLLEDNFDDWENKPDIDIFAYSPESMIEAINILQYKYQFKFGSEDTNRSMLQEEQKYKWLKQRRVNKDWKLHTVKMNNDGITINISNKQKCTNVAEVIATFDMSIICRGWDIPGQFLYDLTQQWSDKKTAVPNKIRHQDTDTLTTAYWVRQFDRVIKYWNRGYDTRPMAKFYLSQIDEVLERGNIWTSEQSELFYKKFVEEFNQTKTKINLWLSDKEDL